MGVIGEFADLDARKHYNGFVFCAPFLLKKKTKARSRYLFSSARLFCDFKVSRTRRAAERIADHR